MSNAIRIDRLDKNYLINGGFDFFGRGGSFGNGTANVGLALTYISVDRFRVKYAGTVTGTPTSSQVANTMSSPKAKWAHQLSAQRNASSLTLTQEQRIEGVEARELVVAGTGAFSIQVFSPIAGATIQLTLNYPTSEDNYTTVTQFYQSTSAAIAASTWTQVTFTNIAIPSNASNGIAVNISLIVPSGTDGSSQNYLLTQAHLSAGITIPVFVRHGKNIIAEKDACQRFFEIVKFTSYLYSGARMLPNGPFKTIKRVTPTFLGFGGLTSINGIISQPNVGALNMGSATAAATIYGIDGPISSDGVNNWGTTPPIAEGFAWYDAEL